MLAQAAVISENLNNSQGKRYFVLNQTAVISENIK